MEKTLVSRKIAAGVFAVLVACAVSLSAGFAYATTSPSASSPSSATPGVATEQAMSASATGASGDYVTSPATGVSL